MRLPNVMLWLAAAPLAVSAPLVASAQQVVGIVNDGPIADDRRRVSIEAIETELRGLLGDEQGVEFPVSKRVNGGWTQAGVRSAVQQLLDDPEVDIVLTTGIVAGSEASRIAPLPKPVVAVVVADHVLQSMPFDATANPPVSGKNNFVYLSDFATIDDEILSFFEAFPFAHLAVLIDDLTYRAVPDLVTEKAAQLEAALGITIALVPVTDSAAAALAGLPAEADAVYVTPLLRLDSSEMQALGAGLIERRLPSFSLLGRDELVDYALLMATSGRAEDAVRLTRRVAINLQRILDGENAGDIGVIFRESKRRIINMETAAAIGVSPSYAVLTEAEQIPPLEIESGEPLTLAMAMLRAIEANLDLQVANFDRLLSAEDVNSARAALRPGLGIGAQRVTIDEDRANPLIQSERSASVELSASQVIYSDDLRARLKLTEYFAEATEHDFRIAILDTYQTAARAYLTVLRARAVERVQRQNLELTRENLELAQIREAVQFSNRSDRLRWEAQFNTDLQNVLAAEADRRGALTALNRILNRPQNQDFVAPENDLVDSIGIFFDDPRFQAFIDNATRWEIFQEFTVAEALDNSPELARLDSLISGQERALLASERKAWLPEFAVGAAAGSVVSRSGAGADLTGTGLDDESWSLAVTANLPLFSGGALRARVNSDRLELRQLEQARLALAEAIEARTRLALYRASGTYPAIVPALDAEVAAAENLTLINEAYSLGAVSITEVIDAQTAANLAGLRAVDTRYAALIDVIDVFRSSGDVSIFLNAGSIETWYQEVGGYFRQHGIDLD